MPQYLCYAQGPVRGGNPGVSIDNDELSQRTQDPAIEEIEMSGRPQGET